MLTKEEILKEIHRTTKENGGVPLGRDRFVRETGITEWEFNKYWPRFSDLQKEAGLKPNSYNTAYDNEYVLDKYISLVREIKKIPTRGDFRFKRRNDPTFPNESVYERFGGKIEVVKKVLEYANEKGFNDVVEFCEAELKLNSRIEQSDDLNKDSIGSVYLFRHGKYYKIGKTNDTVRRGNELKIQLPESLDLIHEIKTDDPSGIEAYWHRRFELKRKNGEWFDLNSSDIKAFKRWRKII